MEKSQPANPTPSPDPVVPPVVPPPDQPENPKIPLLKSRKTVYLLVILGLLALSTALLAVFATRQSEPEIPTPSSSEAKSDLAEVLTEDGAASWQTYTSKNFSFEIKHPPHLKISESISELNQGVVSISDENPCSLENQVIYININNDFLPNSNPLFSEEIIVADIETVLESFNLPENDHCLVIDKAKPGDRLLASIEFKKDGNQWSLNSNIRQKEAEKDLALFKQIISTFRFLEAAPSSAPSSETQLQKLSITYASQPNWQTYSDPVAGFSFQYNTTPIPPYNLHQSLGANEAGKSVVIMTCNTPLTGPNAGQEICLRYFDATIYSNYTDGSRREWFTQNIQDYPNCQRYYADLSLAGANALIATSNCSSWGETYILIPNGPQMIVFTAQGYSRSDSTRTITLTDPLREILSTFKFID